MKTEEQIRAQLDKMHEKISKQGSPGILYTVRLAEINALNWVLDEEKEWRGL
jgi:hypothetical protein